MADVGSPAASPSVQLPAVTPSEPYDAAANRLLDEIRRTVRTREYSLKTERSYLSWVRRFLRFHAGSFDHPEQFAAGHATSFLEHLALNERLAARSRNQAAAALSFMFREILVVTK
ncbi:MAG: site-specific integrase [Gemmatimonadota bacterium]